MKKPDDIFSDHFEAWLGEPTAMPENVNEESENAIIRYAEAYAINPPETLKQIILQKIESLQAAERNQETLNIDSLPLLDANANWLDWQACVQHLSPPDNFEDVFLHELEVSPQRTLFVAWVKEYIDEEVHHDLVESFILLEGTCECNIIGADGNVRIIRLTPGDYIEIPVGLPHHIHITSLQPVKAILQWKHIA